jgi:hypothetical protein
MYYPDLSVYEYIQYEGDNILNIGWLDKQHEFSKGEVPKEFLDKLLYICVYKKTNQTRGFHKSPFFSFRNIFALKNIGYPVRLESKIYFLGSAEIRVKGQRDIIYASPDLIYHYVKDCKYLPPKEFIEAVMKDKCS